ncbi:uncharacterized protein LOC125679047 isoform X2 [Ostrea edulis]|uniref:uncharacterized protein LOC125679047 isoform X2 n=1 Tax=Ostrea edulis TaxID=37623 RepID=UPI0024AF85BE|nr:uncharacterized protein LOC125679047 isoform X2 [Ostrea edulis]
MRVQLIPSEVGIIVIACCLTGILCSSNHYIDWSEASKQCKSKYDSELISEQYIATENLTEDIIQELGFNIAAWIDGKEQELGCRNDTGTCFKIKQMHTKNDRKMPRVCAIGDIDIGQEEVTYEKAKEICEPVKFKSSDAVNSKIAARVDDLYHKSTTFWLPNIELESNRDITCTYVVSRDNVTLETMHDNCTIPKMGVCINTSYIPDYQMTTILEITTMTTEVQEIPDTAHEEIPSAQPQIFTETGNWNQWDMKTLLPFAFSGFNLILFMTLMCVMLVLWKRVTSKWNLLAKTANPHTHHDAGRSQKKSKSKHKGFLRNKEYEGLPQDSSGNSTRVKMVPENDENPYSEISGKGVPCFGNETGAFDTPGYVDMRGMQSRGDPYSSFNIGKNSTRKINSRYVMHGDIV